MMLDRSTREMMRHTIRNQFTPTYVEIYKVTITNNEFGEEIRTRRETSNSLNDRVKAFITSVSASERKLITGLVNPGTEIAETIKFIFNYNEDTSEFNEIKTKHDSKYWIVAHINNTQTYAIATEVLAYRTTVVND